MITARLSIREDMTLSLSSAKSTDCLLNMPVRIYAEAAAHVVVCKPGLLSGLNRQISS
jgi:hypothetical protein